MVIDPHREHIAVTEARKLGIKVVALLDTDCDPDLVDLPIPGNDDSMRSIELVVKRLTDAIIEGRASAPAEPPPREGAEAAGPGGQRGDRRGDRRGGGGPPAARGGPGGARRAGSAGARPGPSARGPRPWRRRPRWPSRSPPRPSPPRSHRRPSRPPSRARGARPTSRPRRSNTGRGPSGRPRPGPALPADAGRPPSLRERDRERAGGRRARPESRSEGMGGGSATRPDDRILAMRSNRTKPHLHRAGRPAGPARSGSQGEMLMAEITAQAVNEFRKKTGLGLMECKTLLKEADGDVKKAIELAKASTARMPRTAPAGPPRPGGSRSTSTTTASRGRWSRSTARPTSSPATRSSASSARTWPSTSSPPTRCTSAARTCPPTSSRSRSGSSWRRSPTSPRTSARRSPRGSSTPGAGENSVLLDQPFVKDDAKTIRELIQEVNARTGENITVGRFARFIVGEALGRTADRRTTELAARMPTGSPRAPLPRTGDSRRWMPRRPPPPRLPPRPAEALGRELLPARRGGDQRRRGEPDRPAGLAGRRAWRRAGHRGRRRQHPPRGHPDPGLQTSSRRRPPTTWA